MERSYKLQLELAEFRKENEFIEPESQIENISEILNDAESKISFLQIQRERLKETRGKIITGDLYIGGFKEFIPTGVASESFTEGQGLRIENPGNNQLEALIAVENDLANKKNIFTPESKKIKNLKKKISIIRKNALENQLEAVDSAINLNNKSLIKAQEQKAKFKDLFKEQPQILGEYENLVLQIKIANENLNGILSSKENFEFQLAQENKPWKIISNAEFSNIPVNQMFQIIYYFQ